jgi:hypothetical protein
MNPDCNKRLVVFHDRQEPITDENTTISSEIAHIHSSRPKGPRYLDTSDDALRSYSNLILLCPDCHKTIDEFPDKYPAEKLEKWREQRETEALDSFIRNTSLLGLVVNAVAHEKVFDTDYSKDELLIPYAIEEKISFNDLSENGSILREYAMFEGALMAIYRELEAQSTFKKMNLLRFVRGEYLKAKGVYLSKTNSSRDNIDGIREHSDEIFNEVHRKAC